MRRRGDRPMSSSHLRVPDPGLDRIRELMRVNGVVRLLAKGLSPNDNSKNQPYLAGSFEVTNILPIGEITVDRSPSGKDTMKAPIALSWLQPDGRALPAPHAKLILYPKYPEVRLSGFLRGCGGAPSDLLNVRMEGRVLLLGVTADRRVIGWVAAPNTVVARAVASMQSPERVGVFTVVPLSADSGNSADSLLAALARIHGKGWIGSHALDGQGLVRPCRATNCVGYTLEAELGVRQNGISAPDFLGWEVKAAQTTNYLRPAAAKAMTLFTPEPTSGFYKTEGFEAFVRKFGYPDKMGREDRLNFGGVFHADVRERNTKLTLRVEGFNAESGKITDAAGRLALVSEDDTLAAAWDFPALLNLWNRKHAQAVYVPAEKRTEPELQYRYAPKVWLGRGTDFTRFLAAVAKGSVYLDPGMKLVGASTDDPEIKRRSQFRVKYRDLESLYAVFEQRDVVGE